MAGALASLALTIYANLTLCMLSIYIVYDQFVIADESYVTEYKLAAVTYGKSDPVEFGKICIRELRLVRRQLLLFHREPH